MEPRVGQLVEHIFLWQREHAAGREEGRYPRPCVIIAVELNPALPDHPVVTVLPISTKAPPALTEVLAIPDAAKYVMGLDPSRSSWILLDEADVFAWPGVDLLPQRRIVAVRAGGKPALIDRDVE